MDLFVVLAVAAAGCFILIWAYVVWLKLREHHHIIRNPEHHHNHHKSHVTFMGRVRPGKKRHD